MADTTCAHCEHPVDGGASVGDQPVCHPDGARLDCYRLVTVYGHPMPCAMCERWGRTTEGTDR